MQRRLAKLAVPLLLLPLSAIPGLVTLHVHQSIPSAVVITALTATSIAAAAVLLRPY
ncbi:hypothetical protein [Rhodococcus sp. ACT016]|uniref:hypothetical protein n=1 Tax=Rhodococcus sp. ACT016 TaxID=3134808 RepID=UPI003D29CFA5